MSFHKYLLKYLLSSLLTSGSSWQKPREKNDWEKSLPLEEQWHQDTFSQGYKHKAKPGW